MPPLSVGVFSWFLIHLTLALLALCQYIYIWCGSHKVSTLLYYCYQICLQDYFYFLFLYSYVDFLSHRCALSCSRNHKPLLKFAGKHMLTLLFGITFGEDNRDGIHLVYCYT